MKYVRLSAGSRSQTSSAVDMGNNCSKTNQSEHETVSETCLLTISKMHQ